MRADAVGLDLAHALIALAARPQPDLAAGGDVVILQRGQDIANLKEGAMAHEMPPLGAVQLGQDPAIGAVDDAGECARAAGEAHGLRCHRMRRARVAAPRHRHAEDIVAHHVDPEERMLTVRFLGESQEGRRAGVSPAQAWGQGRGRHGGKKGAAGDHGELRSDADPCRSGRHGRI